jgi:hypothetical protein
MFIKNRYFMQPLFNADGGTGGSDPNAGGAGNEGGNGAEGGQGGEPDKRFTQAELDAIIKDRLAKEKRKAEEKADEARKEAEREALKEQEKYKELYEQLQKDLLAEKGNALASKKQALLVAEGYTKEQADKYVKFIEGTTDDELATAITAFKADVPPKGATYVDPATQGNGGKQDPKNEDPKDFGKSVFQRLKASGRIKK